MAESRLGDELSRHFLAFNRDERVIGQAVNIKNGDSTEMRIRIDDENYRGMESDGDTLYDDFNQVRLENAQGVPYVHACNKKARYKLENLDYQGRSFVPFDFRVLARGSGDPSVGMVLEGDYERDEPSKLHVPDKVSGFVEGILSDLGNEETEVHEYPYSTSVSLEKQGRNGDEEIYRIGDGERGHKEVARQIQSEVDSLSCAEIRLDAESESAIAVASELEENEGWFYSGFDPAMDGDSYEVTMMNTEPVYDVWLTEASENMFEQLEIPYSHRDDYEDLDEVKSKPVDVGDSIY